MATSNSKTKLKLTVAMLFWATGGIVFADVTTNKIFAERARAEFSRTQKQFESDTNDAASEWQFARACFDFADFATNDAERAVIASDGIVACRQLIAREPKSTPAHYYLGMNLAQLAHTELIGALKLVKEMEREFKTTGSLDKNFDYAGPERNLGLLYRETPGWPASIGSKRKARNFLEQAVKLAPDYPENILNLAESYLKWSEPDHAKKELNALDSIWSKAQTDFDGEAWEQSWADWSTRRDDLRKKLEEKNKSKPAKNS